MTNHNDIDVEFLLSHDGSTGDKVRRLSAEAGVRLQSVQYTDGWQSRKRKAFMQKMFTDSKMFCMSC